MKFSSKKKVIIIIVILILIPLIYILLIWLYAYITILGWHTTSYIGVSKHQLLYLYKNIKNDNELKISHYSGDSSSENAIVIHAYNRNEHILLNWIDFIHYDSLDDFKIINDNTFRIKIHPANKPKADTVITLVNFFKFDK